VKPTTLRCADSDFVPFSQTVGLNYWYCDTVGCEQEAWWQRTVRGVTLLYCTPCKRTAEEGGEA
jgi:hypothetical protein